VDCFGISLTPVPSLPRFSELWLCRLLPRLSCKYRKKKKKKKKELTKMHESIQFSSRKDFFCAICLPKIIKNQNVLGVLGGNGRGCFSKNVQNDGQTILGKVRSLSHTSNALPFHELIFVGSASLLDAQC